MSAAQDSTTPGRKYPPHDPDPPYTGVGSSDVQVLRSRAITSSVAAAGGFRTITASEATSFGFPAHAGLLIPSYNTQGEIQRYQLRPHHPAIDPKTGKSRKYLWRKGSRQSIDVPPASLSALRVVEIPIIVTESGLKAAAIVSAMEAAGIGSMAYAVIAVAGVYGWRSEKMPLSDFNDIPWQGRPVYIAFDSDALTNPHVTSARWGLSEFLRATGNR